jgi:hypothetical protein
MIKRLALVLALAPAAACGGKSSSADTTPKAPETTAAAAPATPGAVLELGEMTVLQGNDAVLKIHADGGTELGGSNNGQIAYQPGPKIHTDGTFESPTGKLGVKLNADGSLVDLTTQKPLPLTVTANDVTIAADGQSVKISLAADGTINVPGATGVTAKVQGADTAGKRKLTLALVGLILLPPPQTPTAAPAPAPEAKPAPTATPPAKK